MGGVKDTCGGTSEASLTSKDAAADGKKSPLCDALTEVVQHVARNYPRHLNTLTGNLTQLKQLDREIHYLNGGTTPKTTDLHILSRNICQMNKLSCPKLILKSLLTSYPTKIDFCLDC